MTVRILIGDGHDRVGIVHSAHDVVVRLMARTGHVRVNAARDVLSAEERIAARRLGCAA